MKQLLLVLFLILSINVYGQVNAIPSGEWVNKDTWGTSWDTPNDTVGTKINMTILNGEVLVGSLVLEAQANSTLTIDSAGILFIDGNLTLNKNITIDVKEGGFLIIDGDILGEKNITVASSGTIVITGSVEADKNTTLDVVDDGAFYILDSVNIVSDNGNTNVDTDGGADGDGKIGGLEDLLKDPNLSIIEKYLGRTLPVDLISFTADINSNVVTLKWETTNEDNFSHFIVQRSNDGRVFEDLSDIYSKGNFQKGTFKYTFTDYPESGRYYYRLKCVDIDYKFEYKGLVMVEYNPFHENVKLYPNPVVDSIIKVRTYGNENMIHILDNSGRVVHVQELFRGENIIKSDLSTGMYLFRIVGGIKQQSGRIVVK